MRKEIINVPKEIQRHLSCSMPPQTSYQQNLWRLGDERKWERIDHPHLGGNSKTIHCEIVESVIFHQDILSCPFSNPKENHWWLISIELSYTMGQVYPKASFHMNQSFQNLKLTRGHIPMMLSTRQILRNYAIAPTQGKFHYTTSLCQLPNALQIHLKSSTCWGVPIST